MRICKNQITKQIRELFNANPLRVPESRIRPMSVIEIADKNPVYLGQFKYLLKDEVSNTPQIKSSAVAEVSNVQTKQIKVKFGFNILENFLKGFGIDPAVVGSSIKHGKKLAFSFENVERQYVETLELGQWLSNNQLLADPNNFLIQKSNGRSPQLALITDVVTSDNFSLFTFKENDMGANIDVPMIEQYVSDANLNLSIDSQATNEIKFKGAQALTFAFSCLEIKIDPMTGRFTRGEWINNLRSIKGEDVDPQFLEADKILIDDDMANPLLLEF